MQELTHKQLKGLEIGRYARYETGCAAIPYERIIEVMDYLPYASALRVSWTFLFLTGARPSEFDKAEINGTESFLKGNWYYWRVGKNQDKGWRKEYLPDAWLSEWREYRRRSRVFSDRMFSISSETVGRYFNRDIRPRLGSAWQERTITARKNGVHEFILQLKGLRKSFGCLALYQEYFHWKDWSVALEFTCQRYRHSNKGITVQHYLKDIKMLDMEKWGGFTPGEVLALASQKHVIDYLPEDNRQSCLMDFSASL